MKLPFAFICLGISVFCFWIAFHDIGTMLNGQPPTPGNIFALVAQNFAR